MASSTPSIDSDVLASFLKEFDFSFALGYEERAKRLVHAPPAAKSPLVGLNNQHPAYSVMGRQVDLASRYVTAIEQWLWSSQWPHLPTHVFMGPLSSSDYGKNDHTRFSLGLAQFRGSWRVLIYRASPYGPGTEGWTKAGKFWVKEWSHCSFADRIATMHMLPGLFREFLAQSARLVDVARAHNEKTLSELDGIAKSLASK